MVSEPAAEKYFQRANPIIAKATHRMMIDKVFDFDEL